VLTRLIFFSTTLFTGLLGAAEPQGGCDKLRVAFYEDGALFYHGADGGWTGIDKDIVDEVTRRMGCTVVPSVDSRVRIWAGLSGGTIDMSVSAIPLPEREKFARFVPYMAGRNYVFLHQDLAPNVHSMEEFLRHPEYKIAVVKAYRYGKSYEAWLARLRSEGRVFETPDYVSMLRLLKLGRVHAAMATPTSWFPMMRQERLAGSFSIMDWAPADSIVSGLVLSRQHVDAATAARFSQTIRAMRDDGTLKRIFSRHVDAEQAAKMLNF
jgi:polar amino acid transport system substrate-binding protein